MSARVRVVLVGAGAIAKTHADALATSARAELVAVVDPAADRAAALAATAGVPSYGDLAALPATLAADAAIVCTPPSTHEELTLALFARGLHVLCEKPFALTAPSARRMLEAADRAGLIVTMASKFRYVEDVVRARALVASGAIGEVVMFENTFASYVDMRGRWNVVPEISGGGVLIDNGTHSVDIVRFLLGAIDDVRAFAARAVQPIPVEDTVHVEIRTHDGAVGFVDLSWSLRKEIPAFFTLYGAGGTIEIGWRASRRRTGGGEWEQFGAGYDKLGAFRAQHDNFAAAIRGEAALAIGPLDALASVHVIEAAYSALRGDRWVPVDAARSAVAVA